MSFVSFIFLLFLPTVVLLHALARRRTVQNGILLLANYVFYGWWDIRFCALILFSSLVDYHVGRALDTARRCGRDRVSRAWLVTSLGINIGLLGFFKYFDFFVESAAIALAGLGLEIHTGTLHILLPVGISFYTFQTLSYTLDIYRGSIHAHKSLLEYLTFVSFFPQLVAGPIERAADLLPQFSRARVFCRVAAMEGSWLLLWGIFKKRVVADSLAPHVDSVFAVPSAASGGEITWATLGFGIQIYADFSGYSDMAAGMARLFGIQLRRNFAYPYFAASLQQFWRRWHISLSTWFRDYVYIALGGSRGSERRVFLAVMATFGISGLWHGAAWHFVLWGLYHGLLLSLERVLAPPSVSGMGVAGAVEAIDGPARGLWQRLRLNFPTVLSGIRTFVLVQAGWLLFRADGMDDVRELGQRWGADLLRIADGRMGWGRMSGDPVGWIWIQVVFLFCVEYLNRHRWNPLPGVKTKWGRWGVASVLVWWIVLSGADRVPAFIYFQF